MSSIIEGYNYDIFISYRQKDNKYDGWVTTFVDNLKKNWKLHSMKIFQYTLMKIPMMDYLRLTMLTKASRTS